MTATTITGLPKNKTGIFAGDTLKEVKPTRNQLNIISTLSSQHRPATSINLLLTSIAQNRLSRNGTQPHCLTDGNTSITSDSSSITNGIRNGFRPSTVRRQKSRIRTAMINRDNTYRDLKDIPVKQSVTPSPASARLKSEIDQINSQLKIYGDLNKILRLQHTRDITATSQSALSYSTSGRVSSASTSVTAGRILQRYPLVMTNETLHTLNLIPGMNDVSNRSIVAPSSPFIEEEDNQNEINHHITHAYQIPQQSNVGSESIFPSNPPSLSTIKTRLTKTNRGHSNENKPISCPFYVMYFTNLTMQQRPNNENKRILSSISTSKGIVNSRLSSTKRQVQSPISMMTYSTIDDDNDSIINTTSYYNNKRFSARMTAFENENSHMLKDVLRTTSWNHVQV